MYMMLPLVLFFVFFFNDTATTEIYTLSLHDALPILTASETLGSRSSSDPGKTSAPSLHSGPATAWSRTRRSEEHTSELQSRLHLVCRLLLEKKKNYHVQHNDAIEAVPPDHASTHVVR